LPKREKHKILGLKKVSHDELEENLSEDNRPVKIIFYHRSIFTAKTKLRETTTSQVNIFTTLVGKESTVTSQVGKGE
jgi:hypothetical protein